MGGGSWDSSAWSGYSKAHTVGKSRAAIFTSRGIADELNPLKFTNGIRESVDSADNPNSTPVMIFTDVTGSMGELAEIVVKNLDVVCQSLLDRKPVPDVHLMTGAIGDAYYDRAPFQATQFEADIRIAEQTQKIYLEGGGGGNAGESYAIAWLFAGMMTTNDSFSKRGKKGYLFTVGDEPVLGVTDDAGVTKDQAKQFLGLNIERDLSAAECLEMARREYNVYHVVVSRSSHYRPGVERTFGKIMPDNLIWLQDVSALNETIVSVIEVNEGKDKAAVAASWSGDKSVAIMDAMRDIVPGGGGQSAVVAL